MNDTVLHRIIALKTTPILELKQLWRDLYQTDPPKFNRQLLEARLGYRIQELAHGGLPQRTVKHLQQLGDQLDGGKKNVRTKRADERPVAGTKLLREFNGVAHEVLVHVDDFDYAGQRFKSLSAIARKITGVSWNGWTFFGLRSTRRNT